MSYQIDRRYDLKGSSKKRTCGKENFHKDNIELKDLDLDMKLQLAPNMYRKISGQINHDVSFLETLKVMDYSLIIGVHRPFKNMVRQQNQSTLQKLISAQSFSLGRWVDPQKFVSNFQMSAQPQRSPSQLMITDGHESFTDRKSIMSTQMMQEPGSYSQYDNEDGMKSRGSVSNLWSSLKSNLNPRHVINKLQQDEQRHSKNSNSEPRVLETQMPANIDILQNQNNRYPDLDQQINSLNKALEAKKLKDVYLQNQEAQQSQQQQNNTGISSEFGSLQQQKKLMISSDQAQYKELDRNESSSGSLERRMQFRTSQSDKTEVANLAKNSGKVKHSDLRAHKLKEQNQQNQWNSQLSPESMVDQIQKLISSGSVFQRINSHVDPNRSINSSANSPESQAMANEMQFITDQINDLIMEKLADYNRLLNIGGGAQNGQQMSESSLVYQQKQGKNNVQQKFGLDLPSDKKDDVIKITMLLVALVVYKLEARETQQKELQKQQAEKKKGSRVLHRDFTMGARANEGQLHTYTDAEWFKKETEGKALGIELHCIANPQKPREQQKSSYENGAEQVVVCMGIIDYLVEFNWYKYMEYSMKIAMYGISGAKGVSVQPPEIYSQRFLKFMKNSLFEKVV